jgi:hypothetical protein
MKWESGRTRKPWTFQDDEDLKRLAKIDGQTAQSIGAAINRTGASVAGRMHNLGIRLSGSRRPNTDPLAGIFLDGEPLIFAEVDRPCARCAVRETVHHEHGCGQFAAEVRVRLR